MENLQDINAEFTVAQEFNQGEPENGLYIVFGCLFLFLFGQAKKNVNLFMAEKKYKTFWSFYPYYLTEHKNELALVLFGGINYYTGKVFDMKTITEAAHKAGAYCGFDLAHAAGNIELHMHDWNVDFACWCSYKYLNSGPGNIAGAYIHERFLTDTSLPRMAGWWGYDKESRFKMTKTFKPIPTAEGWQLSNSPIISMAAHKSSLDIFEEAGMEDLLKKSKLLTVYLLFILDEINTNRSFQVITPANENERGCQVSILMLQKGKDVFNALKKHGVLSDWREPDVIRVAPVPLYNSFKDVYQFGQILKHLTNV